MDILSGEEEDSVQGLSLRRSNRQRKQRFLFTRRRHSKDIISLKPSLPPQNLALSPAAQVCLAIEHNYSLSHAESVSGLLAEQNQFSSVQREVCSERIIEVQNVIKEEVFDNQQGTYEDLSQKSHIINHPRTSSSDSQSIKDLLVDVNKKIRHALPKQWISIVSDNGIHLLMMSKGEVKVSQRDLFVQPGGSMRLSVHGQCVPEVHEIWDELLKPYKFDSLTPPQFAQYLCMLANIVNKYVVCVGFLTEAHEDLWKLKHDEVVDENHFHETHYSRTVRSRHCLKLVPKDSFPRCCICDSIFEKTQITNNAERNNLTVSDIPSQNPTQNPSAICFQFMSV